jgi:hypothetical protein
MAGTKQPELDERQVVGLRMLERVAPMLVRLRPVGCERDRAGNRELFFDQLCLLILLYLFNPLVHSLRSIQRASELKNVRRKLGCGRVSLGSLSEALRVFDPEMMRSIVEEAGAQLSPVGRDSRLDEVRKTITLVDGTVLRALPTLVEATLCRKNPQPRYTWRLHMHFELLRHCVTDVKVTGGVNRGAAAEKAVLRERLQPDHCYVVDRGYQSYDLFNRIQSIDSSYVARTLDNAQFQASECRELSEAAIAANVVRDEVGCLGGESSQTDHLTRLVEIRIPPHLVRPTAGKDFKHQRDRILLATNLLDVPAELIALIYQRRWTIELFFRFFKHTLGCRHLISNDPDGITIQVYCAILACLLMSLWSGRKPTRATYEMVGHYLTGLADEEELLNHFAKLATLPA